MTDYRVGYIASILIQREVTRVAVFFPFSQVVIGYPVTPVDAFIIVSLTHTHNYVRIQVLVLVIDCQSRGTQIKLCKLNMADSSSIVTRAEI